MTAQRFGILIFSILGIIFTFLPWVQGIFDPSIEIAGEGWTTSGLFLMTAVISLTGDKANLLNRKILWCITIGGIFIVGIAKWKIINIMSKSGVTVGIGLYLVLIISLILVIITLPLKVKQATNKP